MKIDRSTSNLSRRDFFKSTALGSAGILITGSTSGPSPLDPGVLRETLRKTPLPLSEASVAKNIDLSPARWIWYPSGRCLSNTFVLFRKNFSLSSRPERATGWIIGDSRYLLHINGRRIQWGPAPSDPRWTEADPVDLAEVLQEGENVLGATVLFYGQGDGTWPAGKPGFICRFELTLPNGETQVLVSDETWHTHLARSWQPGHYKRWYLRALQEEFDARRYPYGWQESSFDPDHDWLPAMILEGPSDKPAICTRFSDYQFDTGVSNPELTSLRARSIPLLVETDVPVTQLVESYQIRWIRPPLEYFESITPGAFEATPVQIQTASDHSWAIDLRDPDGIALTFKLEEQIVGWPYFTIEAPEGTVIEMMVHEAHRPGGPSLLTTHFNSWCRFTCREGVNTFEPFDFESFRWLQLHIHGTSGKAVVRRIGVRRRMYPWNTPSITCSDPKIQKVLEASINTIYNAAQDTIVDGMGRERQQYSGDVGHQLHAIYHTFGEKQLPARYLETFSQGLTLDGYFLDCWPAYDRLARISQRQLGLTRWGPLLDHGVGFNFDTWHHYLYTGDLESIKGVFPRLLRFYEYLRSIQDEDGLLPVENIGVPTVWIDHNAYRHQRHKQCAFNLYAVAMAEHALAPLCRAFEETEKAREVSAFGKELLKQVFSHFWSDERGLFVNNLPWLREEGEARLCDRSLATAVLFDLFPDRRSAAAAITALSEVPPEMGLSYPANAGWRLWALAKGRRIDVILDDLRTRWWPMSSVQLNNTLQEDWTAEPDSGAQWSHCPVAPLYVAYMSLAGINPTAPAFEQYRVQPQLGDLEQFDLISRTVQGPITFSARGVLPERRISITTPERASGVLIVDEREELDLKPASEASGNGLRAFDLLPGTETKITLRFT